MIYTYMGLMLALTVKHYVADVPLQPLWMGLNKGTFLHPGGLAHAGVHGGLMLLTLGLFKLGVGLPAGWGLLLGVSAIDAVLHYGIDWAKMNIDRRFAFSHLLYKAADGTVTPDKTQGVLHGRLVTSNLYYWALVGDQCLHFATMVVLGALVLV